MGHSWFLQMRLCILVLGVFNVSLISGYGTVGVQGTVYVDGKSRIGRTDSDFICATLDWWPPEKCDYGTCAWGHASLLNLDLSNIIFLNAIKAFSPLKIRLGGTLQDKVVYQTRDDRVPCTSFVSNTSEIFSFSQGCLPLSRWDELNVFFNKSGAVIIFGLNALTGRSIQSDASTVGAWDSTNAESLMKYTVEKGYTIHGWELGNELSGSGVGVRVAADQYASDTSHLHNIVQNIYKDASYKPLIIAPGGFFDANWFTEFVDKTNNSLDVITHHIYNLGPGRDEHLIEKILDPSYLDGEADTFNLLRSILNSSETSVNAWVGEAGGAYNSGRNHVTNAFVFSFWYLDQLGMSASYDTKTYCRQTLIGGNYGLLNTTTFVPNPDYYSALLWHRLMGRNALSTSFSGTKKIRAYAHCAKQSGGITLLLINLDSNTTVEANVAYNGSFVHHRKHISHINHHHHRHHSHSHGKRSAPRSQKRGTMTREEYHLTANGGDLHSQTMLLNGNELSVDSSGSIPEMKPRYLNSSEPITVAPFSIVFAHIPYVFLPACR
nr:heparanase-like protein 3 [Ipomoea trifida]